MSTKPLTFNEWRRTPCPCPDHFHNGPNRECYRLASILARPNMIRCSRCWQPTRRNEVCVCGMDYTPKPSPALSFGPSRPMREWEPDGFGCVVKTSAVERLLAGDGPYS